MEQDATTPEQPAQPLKVYTGSPYDFNAVSLGERKEVPYEPQGVSMDFAETAKVTHPYPDVAKVFDINVRYEWSDSFGKVWDIVEWIKSQFSTRTPKDTLRKLDWVLRWGVSSRDERPRIDQIHRLARKYLDKHELKKRYHL